MFPYLQTLDTDTNGHQISQGTSLKYYLLFNDLCKTVNNSTIHSLTGLCWWILGLEQVLIGMLDKDKNEMVFLLLIVKPYNLLS
jgi:hypothetical protein